MVDNSFNEDSENIIFLAWEALILGQGLPKTLGKMAKTGNLLLCKLGSGHVL